jgi:hypothetical protein
MHFRSTKEDSMNMDQEMIHEEEYFDDFTDYGYRDLCSSFEPAKIGNENDQYMKP